MTIAASCILQYLAKHPWLTAKELAEDSGLTVDDVKANLQALLCDGLIQRKEAGELIVWGVA